MKRVIYNAAKWLLNKRLSRKGWALSDNVTISFRDVCKIGGVKSTALKMCALTLVQCLWLSLI